MTETEPVTLEEEYEMQESWIKDEDSIVFIYYKHRIDIHYFNRE